MHEAPKKWQQYFGKQPKKGTVEGGLTWRTRFQCYSLSKVNCDQINLTELKGKTTNQPTKQTVDESGCSTLPLLLKLNSIYHLRIWSRSSSSASSLCCNGTLCFLKAWLMPALKNAKYPCHLSLIEPSSQLAFSTWPTYHEASPQVCTSQNGDPALV